ncbi:unnamed protein product [Effrenium voratum]|uniref:VOC domain-containing protein n=1 Tax=Effrenium voratum TaxID=2562239 RepID=A0AA36NGH5_9DINO|nr:unnamed protein product [Effrenium voratum]
MTLAMKVRLLFALLAWSAVTMVGLVLLDFYPSAVQVLLVAGNALVALVTFFLSFRQLPATPTPEPLLHWNPELPRRGMGDLIRSVNHIAIIVSDVGRSLAFYTEIIGFQQFQRPNFDRHGAWLTMGNLELHLIKGVPNAPSGRDLIVSHIALETDHPEKVLEKLLEFEVPFRQNISVPDPKKARDNLVEAFENSEGKITQYFVRDPDGYYLELCNCDVLTAFCLFKETAKVGHTPKYMQLMDAMLRTYNESGQMKASPFRFPQLAKTALVVHRLVRKVRAELCKSFEERVNTALNGVEAAAEPDPKMLARFLARQKTYCDICQGFSDEALAAALCKSANHAPTALLLLSASRADVRIWMPPVYFLSEGGRIQQQVMAVAAPPRRNFGSCSVFASKPFEDANGRSLRQSVGDLLTGFSAGRPVEATNSCKGRNSIRGMLSLGFENDPVMQDYLRKSSRFSCHQTQETEICV